MPGITKNTPEIAGAICGPPPQREENGATVEESQPRQPTNLQGLLRFAMEATKAEDAPGTSNTLPMDEERKKFLEDALNSMSVNVIEVLQKQVQVLQTVGSLSDDADCSEHVSAIQTILEYIDDIDVANDFHKIDGFLVLRPCLRSSHAEIRAGACEIIAELCQNNPYCQKVILEQGFIPLLLQILENEEDGQVLVKAIYAISCIVRANMEGLQQIIQYGGLNVFLNALQKNIDKLRTKITFLLSSMCRMEPDIKSRLVFLEYVPVLIKLISQERMPSHEHVLSLLLSVVEENQTAVNECKNPEHDFEQILKRHLDLVRNKPESLEEERYCKLLLRSLFVNNEEKQK